MKPHGLRAAAALCLAACAHAATFRVGVAAADVSPRSLPIRRSGGFLSLVGERLDAPLYVRALVMDDGAQRVGLVIADTLAIPRELADGIKQQAARRSGLPPERILIAATHTHSAPPLMSALGTDEEPVYKEYFAPRVVEAVCRAAADLRPARLGWAVVEAPEFTHCRRWILRPERMRKDPFGELTVRANMHPGYQNPEFIGPAGPVDAQLTVLAFQSAGGEPLALLANYSMHYVGVAANLISPDYFGVFVEEIARLIGAGPEFAAMMSQATSGDQHWMDYSRPKQETDARSYAAQLARRAFEAYRQIRYRDWAPLRMRETRLDLERRPPSPERLAWARAIAAEIRGEPRNQQEVYAREQIYLAEEPRRELKLQGLAIGELGIAAIPCEVFGITGLKIKAASPLNPTLTITFANGAEGYIPPPEQHLFGGYTTWPARTAGLEVQAEPKILEAVLSLLEQVAGRRRRAPQRKLPPAARRILVERPLAWWRLEEMSGPEAHDWSGHNRTARYEGRVAFHLEGAPEMGRAPYFAGGRLSARLRGLGSRWSLAMWFWPLRPGSLLEAGGRRLTLEASGRLALGNGGATFTGNAPVALEKWQRLLLVHEQERTLVYVDGRLDITAVTGPWTPEQITLAEEYEGRLDEVAVFARSLRPF